jgi:hypothetical protein
MTPNRGAQDRGGAGEISGSPGQEGQECQEGEGRNHYALEPSGPQRGWEDERAALSA